MGNGRILREGPFENLWIQPAAGDAGGALGAALFVWHQLLEQAAHGRAPATASTARSSGPRFSDDEIRSFWLDRQAPCTRAASPTSELCDDVAELLATEKVVGWFQGRMEFGPRALGRPQHPRRRAQHARCSR